MSDDIDPIDPSEEEEPASNPLELPAGKDNAQADPDVDPVKQDIIFFTRLLVGSILKFVRELMNIKDDTNEQGAIEAIKSGIEFKGYNVWILICSIFIASIGLNISSTAVIIGAMLISPLMGPILGVGLAVGTNDFKTLIKSLKNYGIMVGISLLAATIYFLISPLNEATPELMSRVSPTILDVLVAVFGGLAGVIAISCEKPTNIIPGVAIATALMPPLCTAGYGLANGNLTYFAGALYLFLLNSVFICLTTFIVIRYLHFPLKEHMDKVRERMVKKYILIFTLLVVVPSTWLFVTVILESKFRLNAEQFLSEQIVGSDLDIHVHSKEVTYTDSISEIIVFVAGEYIPPPTEREWRKQLPFYDLDDCRFTLYQNALNPELFETKATDSEAVTALLDGQNDLRLERDELEDQNDLLLRELDGVRGKTISFGTLQQNMKISFKEIEQFSYGLTVQSGLSGTADSIFTFVVEWKTSVDTALLPSRERDLHDFLKLNLKQDSVRIMHYER
jgi:uncharacterized hydrophobic protein (TIGR00271 family)